MGFEMALSLLGGLAAKEVIVTTLGTAYSQYDSGEDSGNLADFIARDLPAKAGPEQHPKQIRHDRRGKPRGVGIEQEKQRRFGQDGQT